MHEQGNGRAKCRLVEPGDFPLPTVRQAARHAWLALECAVAGETLWNAVSCSLAATEANVFRQQMEALLDLLSLAGLPDGESGARRRCSEELRSARQVGLAAVEELDALGPTFSFPLLKDTATELEAENVQWQVLRDVTGALDQAGFPQLARLVALRSPWGEALFLEIVEYFLRRALRANPDLGLSFPDAGNDSNGACWRCLERIARLLEERADALEALLDNPEEDSAHHLAGRNPEAIERLFQQGLSRYQHGEYRQAALHFTAALKLDPTDARLYAYRGDAYRLLCEYERAIADFTMSLRLDAAEPSVLVSRANAYHCSGEHARAIEDCRAALASNPNNATAYRVCAAAHAETGATDLALDDLTAALALAPEDEEAHYQRGVLHVGQREYAAAIADFDRVLKLNAHHVPTYLHRAYARRCLTDYAGAISDYSVVLRYHPSNVLAYAGRGSAYRLMGDLDRAHADYQEALNLEPENAQVHCSQGILYRIKGDLERAGSLLAEAIRLDPRNPAALYHRSKVFLAQGHFPAALADLTSALALNSQIVVAYLSRAVIHDRLGQYQEALADGNQAVTRDPRSPAARLVCGVAHAHLGQHEAAIEDLTEAIQLDQRFALAYHERSIAYTMRGDHEQALADCNQLLALELGNAQAFAHRSILHHMKGDLPQALMDYSRAMQLDPQCLLLGLHQGLAERARLQTAQRLAEYIDGLRQEPAAAEPPPPAKFRIVLKSAGAQQPASTDAEQTPSKAGPPAAGHVPQKEKPNSVTTTLRHRRMSTERLRRPERAPEVEAEETVAEAASVNETMRHQPTPTEQLQLQQEITTEDESAEAIAAQLMSADETSEEETGLELLEDNAASDGTAAPAALESKSASPSAPIPFQASPAPKPKSDKPAKVNWAKLARPTATPPATPLAAPKSPPTPSAPADDHNPLNRRLYKPPKQLPKKQIEEEAEPGLLRTLLKPRVLGVVVIAAAALIWLGFHFTRTDRVRVFPAHGQATLGGKPMPGALIMLEPVWTKEPPFPLPRATVKDDGSFALGTYGKEDGAPAGEYRVSVQWLLKMDRQEVEGGALPKNVLPPRYGKFETSGLTVQIDAGDNSLPAFQLKH
jgi:tetratricopeptide (TPR) repeat protein